MRRPKVQCDCEEKLHDEVISQYGLDGLVRTLRIALDCSVRFMTAFMTRYYFISG